MSLARESQSSEGTRAATPAGAVSEALSLFETPSSIMGSLPVDK